MSRIRPHTLCNYCSGKPRSIGYLHSASRWEAGSRLVRQDISYVLSNPKAVTAFRKALSYINPLKPNDLYIGCTAPLTSRRCILYIYSTNIHTEYIKHAAQSPFFSLQNAVYFIIYLVWFLYYSHFTYRVC